MKEDFKFFIPVDFEKASKEKDASKKMRIKGIASTIDKDSDDESLDPQGFELDFFLKSGFINWHHRSKDDPSAIVGEPTKAEVTDQGLYIEGELYEDSDLAKSIYKLAKTLKSRGGDRRLGFSIEGKVLERDLVDSTQVKKALITGCAITPTPKNPYTIMDVIKGKDTSGELEYSYEPSKEADGGKTYIIDIMRPDGLRVTVDENFNVNIIKTLSTDSGRALITESVEGKTKNQKEDFTVTNKNSKLVNKSKAFAKILSHVNDVEKAQKVYKHLNENFEDMSKEEEKDPTSEEIYKALETLGLEPDEAEEIEKGESGEAEDEIEKGEGEDAIEKAKKAKKSKDDDDDDGGDSDDNEEMSEEEYAEMKGKMKKAKKEYEMMKAKVESHASHPANKGGSSNISKSDDDEISTAKENALDTIKKSFEGMNSKLDKLDELEKAFESVDFSKIDKLEKALDTVEELEGRLKKVEEQPMGRKSVATKNYIEKSFDGNGVGSDNKEVSLTKNRNEVLSILKNKSGIEKGEVNEFYADALMGFESSGTISKAIAEDLRQNDNVILTQ